jgi:tetratricopeptide (TPR) repeat protein
MPFISRLLLLSLLLSPLPAQAAPDSATSIVTELTATLRQNPNNATAYRQRAELIWLPGTLENTPANQANIKRAIADYTQALQLDPNQGSLIYAKRAELQHKLGNLPAAIADYTQAIKLAPKRLELYQSRLELQIVTKDYKSAIAELTTALTSHPELTELYFHRGQLHSYQQNSKAAIADFLTIIQKQEAKPGRENLAQFYLARGWENFKIGENEAAIGDLTGCISNQPDNVQAYLLRSDTFANMNIHDRALTDLQKAIDLLKQKQEDTFGIHRTYLQAAQKRQIAQIEIRRQKQSLKSPKTGEEWLEQGLRWVDRGIYFDANAAFTRAIQLNPKLADAYRYRATAKLLADFDYDSLHRFQAQTDPIADLTTAIQLQPNRADLYKLRAQAYQVNSDYPKALADVNRAITLTPKDLELYFQRQKIHITLGDTKAEQADVEQIRRLEASSK